MMIDTFSNMPVHQEVDIRVKKKDEGQDMRPIEESGKGNSPELDFNKEEASDVKNSDRKTDAHDTRQEIYNAEGKLLKDNRVEREVNTDPGNLDVIV